MSADSGGSLKRVLVVDDNPVNLKITAALVRRAGFQAETAETGEDALEQVRAKAPDLIVTDLQLPGMDGLEVARWVKKHPAWRHIPIILLTAAHSKEGDALARQAGCECAIGKPVDAEVFPGIIRAFVGVFDTAAESAAQETLPLDQLSKEFLEGGASECRDLLSQFGASRMFAPELDFVSIRKSLHRWAGVGGTLGAPEITRLARDLEAFLATFQPSQRDTLRQKLTELLQQFLQAV